MKKAVSLLAVVVFCIGSFGFCESVQNSPNLDCVDTPTCNTLLRGMYNFHMRFYESGGVLTRAWVGFASTFMIGATFNLDNVIGAGNVTGREPKILAKIKIIEDSTAFPSLAIGYEPQSFGELASDKYSTKPVGIYAVVTKNLLSGLFVTGGVGNHNVFTDFKFDTDLNVFASVILMLNPDFALLVEYNDIISKDWGSLNIGLRYAFAPELRIEVDFKGLTKKPEDFIRNLRIDYVNYF
ncbi:MAG: hypothetical protein ABH873_02530 [Candidatus Firestonebacteria bacterium]